MVLQRSTSSWNYAITRSRSSVSFAEAATYRHCRYDQAEMATRATSIDARQVARISKALADPSRFEMLRKIGECDEAPTCSCIREWLNLAPATITHHLKELENAGLVHIEREGKFAYISVRRDVLKAYLNRLASI
jgi:ArsR family transcriptional regulator, arsenate/arsenite/antimonite-responsive transcriptional repressor